jgi:CxxC-x17-CxxC domain-containing protein
MAYGNFRGNSGSSGGFGGRRPGGFKRSFGPREMTKIKCSQCGKEDEVPFKPRDGSTVLCKDCYFKSKGIEPRNNNFNKEAPAKKEVQEEAETADEAEEANSEDF